MNALITLALLLQDTEPTDAAPPQGPPSMIYLYVLIFVIIYFVAIRPGSKEKKKREALLAGLAKGDKVMTSSGLFGTVATVQGDVVTLQVADGVRLRFSRQAIQTILTDEDVKEKVKELEEK